MRKFVLSVLVSIIMAIGLVSARPLVINANTSGNQVGFTNNTSYSGTLKLFRYETQAIYPSTGGQYTYAYYFQADPGMYGVISGRMNDSTSEIFTVAVQNGISETFFSNQQSAYVYSVQLVEYNQTLPQEVIDYIANMDSNVELTTELLDKLLLMRQWGFPVESYNAITANLHLELVGFTNNSYWTYPQFKVNQNQLVFNNIWTNQNKGDIEIVLMVQTSFAVDTISRFNQLFSYNTDRYTIKSFKFINYISNTGSLFKINFSSSASGYFSLTALQNITYIVPVFFGQSYYNASTDFALNYGLTNQLLDDLHIVAQGTTNSNNSSSDLEDSAQEYGDLADDVLGLEDDLGSGFSSSLNNVPTTFNFSTQFGNKFLHSATWVRTQFENLTTNTPFGALITFSLVLGLALLLVGRRLL